MDKFDPYYEWLAIPPRERPPNYYRLLGTDLFEENFTVIEHAADQRMAHLRTFQMGKHSAESQKLLNEIAAARNCLLNPAKKAEYDEELRRQTAAESLPPEKVAFDPARLGLDVPPVKPAPATNQPRQWVGRNSSWQLTAAIGAGLLASVAIFGYLLAVRPHEVNKSARTGTGAGDKRTTNPPDQPLSGPKSTIKDNSHGDERPPDREPEPPPPDDPASGSAKGGEEGNVAPETPPGSEPAPTETPKAPEAPAETIALPSTEKQQRLQQAIDEAYQSQKAVDRPARVALARKLLEDGRKRETNRDEQFVLLRHAGEIACDAGEADLMIEAVDALVVASFDIKPYQAKAWWLKRALKQNADAATAQFVAIVACCLRFAEKATADGAIEEASTVFVAARDALVTLHRQAKEASSRARANLIPARTRNLSDKDRADREKNVQEADENLKAIADAVAAVNDCGKGLQQIRREQEAKEAAVQRLNSQPDDPDASLVVGRWHCLFQNKWDEGLKLLAKGSDEAMKSLAKDELSKPTTTEQKLACAHAWWEQSEKATGRPKAAMRHRAGYWYQQALDALAPGLDKDLAQRRLEQLAGDALPAPVAGLPAGKEAAPRRPVSTRTNLGSLTRGLLAHWTFDQESDPGRDQAGNYHLEFGNDTATPVRIADGPAGIAAMRFSDSVRANGSGQMVNGLTPRQLTFAAWVRPSNDWANSGHHCIICCKEWSKHESNGWYVKRENDDTVTLVVDGDNNGFTVFVPRKFSQGVWTHIALLFDSNTPHFSAFQDGRLVALDRIRLNKRPASISSPGVDKTSLRLGHDMYWTGSSFGAGDIADVRIYGRILSATEVKSLASQSGR